MRRRYKKYAVGMQCSYFFFLNILLVVMGGTRLVDGWLDGSFEGEAAEGRETEKRRLREEGDEGMVEGIRIEKKEVSKCR